MSERNHWNQGQRNQHTGLNIDHNIDQYDKKSANFSQNLSSVDSLSYEESENFNAHVITRMPDLSGLDCDSDPQNISLYRPKSGVRLPLKWATLRNISLQKWSASIAICLVVVIVVWSVFRNPTERPDVVKNEEPNVGQKAMPPEWDQRQGEPMFGFPQTMNNSHVASESRTEPFPVPGDSYFTFDTTPSATNTGMFSQGTANIPDAAMVTPDSQSNSFAPWERHPNTGTASTPQPQFDFAAAQPHQNQSTFPENQWANNHPNNNQFQGYQSTAGSQGQNMPQVGMSDPMTGYSTPQQNFAGMPPYAAPAQPGSMQPNMSTGHSQQNAGFAGMSNNTAPLGQEMIAMQGGTPTPSYPQQQLQGSFPTQTPQQMYYMQSPPNHENAVAVNPHAMPSYGQMQAEPQRNSDYNNMTYHTNTMSNQGVNPQPPYMGGQPSVAQANYSNVPVAASDRSFRDQPSIMNGANGTNVPTTPQGGFPYDGTYMSQSPDYYR